MAETFEVTGEYDHDHDVMALTLRYSHELPFNFDEGRNMIGRLVSIYEELSMNHDQSSCILVIDAEYVGSFMIRGLFELYQKIRTKEPENGNLIVVGFPPRDIPALSALMLHELPGFSLAKSTSEALERLSP